MLGFSSVVKEDKKTIPVREVQEPKMPDNELNDGHGGCDPT
jgi:hypothetical protein